MEIAKECPKGFIEIAKELHKVQLNCIEAGIVCSVDNNYIDSYAWVNIYIFDPNPKKGCKQVGSFEFYSDEGPVEEHGKKWKKMLEYYERMKAKAEKKKSQKKGVII